MKATTKRTITIFLAILLLIVSVFIYTSLIKPAYGEVKVLRSKAETLKQTLITFRSLNDQLQQLFSEYQNLSNLGEQMSTILPSSVNVPYAVGQIAGIASFNRLEIQSLDVKQLAIKPASEILAKGLGTLRMDLKLAGDYEKIKSYLKNIENNLMISRVVNFKIEKQGASQDLLFGLTVDTYYQVEN
ncbi:MAG: type 4a pilus biogenesis protein PilO [Patescibacteria group bacterium]